MAVKIPAKLLLLQQKIISQVSLIRPVHIKTVFYNLPLLINWLPGITFEKDESYVRMSERNMGLSMYFISGLMIIYSVYSLSLRLIPGNSQFISNLFGFTFHSILAASYTGISIFFMYSEFSGKKVPDSLNAACLNAAGSFRRFFEQ
jgi:hypothetical protein